MNKSNSELKEIILRIFVIGNYYSDNLERSLSDQTRDKE